MRDLTQSIILPSLTRALDELTGKKGSRSRARLLVKHARDQLLALVHEDKPTVTADVRDSAARAAGHRQTDPDTKHDFTHSATGDGRRVCRCGAIEVRMTAESPRQDRTPAHGIECVHGIVIEDHCESCERSAPARRGVSDQNGHRCIAFSTVSVSTSSSPAQSRVAGCSALMTCHHQNKTTLR